MRMTFAGPRLVPDGRRRVAGFPLIEELRRELERCHWWKSLLNLKSKSTKSQRVNEAVFFWYPAVRFMSTRTILASVAIVCIVVSASFVCADNSSRSGESALPSGALKSASSMYLRQAASSAIRWQPWNASTFALARSLNRPVLIDIGAIWCHWCHVMDETTYSDPEIDAILNSNFVPVKVDTDERPDIDAYYQSAAEHLTGAGGWPLTCFTTSNGALFFAAGYVPPRPGTGPDGSGGKNTAMLPLLRRIADVYAHDRIALERQADANAAKLKAQPVIDQPHQTGLDALRAEILAGLQSSYDRDAGGFAAGSGPRFYNFPAVRLALAHGFYGHPEFTAMSLDTLRKISAGGVFDQLGGGFHRYSTDQNWAVPHFEKLGYDNAMALDAYAQAYEASGDEDLARVARSIAGYVNRELLDPKTHAFYSHQDADSFKGDDGSYYTWTIDEVKRALPPDESHAAIIFFGMDNSPARAPDGRIVLRRVMNSAQLANRLKISGPLARATIDKVSATMLAVRARRKTPQVDHAVMTDRNALMAAAYLEASAALNDEHLKRIALDDLDFILAHLRDADGSFHHVWSDDRAHVSGLASDQVYLLNALIDAYQYSGVVKYLDAARSLAGIVLKDFREPVSSLIVDRKGDNRGAPQVGAVASSQAFYDMPMPSTQATAAIAMRKLGLITGDANYAKAASDLLGGAASAGAAAMIGSVGTLGLALEYRAHPDVVITIGGAMQNDRRDGLWNSALPTYRPGKVAKRIESGGEGAPSKPAAIVCAGLACAPPTEDSKKLKQLIKTFEVGSISTAAGVTAKEESTDAQATRDNGHKRN
ncbi:MAG: uncharacterized protein QOK03_1303 [Candidatus Binataceae bacterium]|nr:uncharacterized protein [Candidatus Binataceae bacterium]